MNFSRYGIVGLRGVCTMVRGIRYPQESVIMRFELQKSRLYFYYLLLTHCFAFFAVWFLSNIFLSLFFASVIAISFFYYLSRPQKIMAVQCVKKNWLITLNSGKVIEAKLLVSSVLWRCLFLLDFKDEKNKKIFLAVFVDQLTCEDFLDLKKRIRIVSM